MTSRKFLIIDDEQGIIEEVRSFFEEEGYEVFTADSVREGIELMERIRPDVLLLDMKLPDGSGIDVLQVTKDISSKTKVIVCTGYVDQQIIDEAERLGRDAFLQKPFNLLVLKEEIERLLGEG